MGARFLIVAPLVNSETNHLDRLDHFLQPLRRLLASLLHFFPAELLVLGHPQLVLRSLLAYLFQDVGYLVKLEIFFLLFRQREDFELFSVQLKLKKEPEAQVSASESHFALALQTVELLQFLDFHGLKSL